MDAMQMAQMAQMEAAYAAQMQAAGYSAAQIQSAGYGAPVAAPAAGPYGQGNQLATLASQRAAAGPVAGVKQTQAYDNNDWGIPGFDEALTEAVMPINDAVMVFSPDQVNSVQDIKTKIGSKILKTAKKFVTDERCQSSGTALQARALVEEFVESCAYAVSQAFYDKPWLEKVNLAAPLLASALHTFNGAKIFTRTLAPMLPKYIEEGLFKYAEEERITKATWDAVVASGVKENMQKKASQHLAKAYDSAHIKAPYGSSTADSGELGMLQDFVKGWMTEFCSVARDVLLHGIGSGSTPTRGEQILFLTILFQNLTDASNAALPHELTSLIESPPPSPWAFIAESAEAVFDEADAAAKQAKMGGGMGGKGWAGGGGGGGWGGNNMMQGMDPNMMQGMMQQMMSMMGGDGGSW